MGDIDEPLRLFSTIIKEEFVERATKEAGEIGGGDWVRRARRRC
jgi:hypothetical protein